MWWWIFGTLGPLAVAGIVALLVQIATRPAKGKHQATVSDPPDYDPDEEWDDEDDDEEEWEDEDDEDSTELMSVFDRRAYIEAQERLAHTAEIYIKQGEWLSAFNAKTPVEQWAEIAHLGVAEWLPERIAA